MSKTKRLRIFSGPNGSGKSTLFTDIANQFKAGHFINSDEIEKEIRSLGYINLEKFGLKLTQNHFEKFLKESNENLDHQQ